MEQNTNIGCAGWSLSSQHQTELGGSGTHLQRYAQRFPAVEINSSFYRPHQPATYSRWAASTPDRFRFSVKLPRSITHEKRLLDIDVELRQFLSAASHLGEKLGPILVQLPPSLRFERQTAREFFHTFRETFSGGVVLEPRHASWLCQSAEDLLQEFQIGRVAADPARPPGTAEPGGWREVTYFRWHGSPKMYYSRYSDAAITDLCRRVATKSASSRTLWVIFDNTAEGAAFWNASELQNELKNTAFEDNEKDLAVPT